MALGHHWALGADKRRGARYLMAAADWAAGMYANADAIQHYQRVLDALARCDEPAAATEIETERLAARERMADLLGPTGRRASALGEYEIVEAGYRAAGDAPARARILRKMGGLHWDAGARARALQCFEAGLAPARKPPTSTSSRRTSTRRWVDWRSAAATASGRSSGRSRRALHAERLAADPALDADGRGEAVTAAAQSHNTLGVACARLGRLEEAVGHIERSVALAQDNRLAAGGLSWARQPERALQHARSGPGDRDGAGRPRDGQEDR